MIEPLIYLIASLLVLWLGAEILIDSAKTIAKSLKISGFFIGLAFVSIGTSIPEIAVSVMGGLDRLWGIETSGLVIGNKVGSAINQLTLIIGVLALFTVLTMERRKLARHGGMLIGAIVLFFVLGIDGSFSVIDGWIAIIVYFLYWLSLFVSEDVLKNARNNAGLSLIKQFILLSLGIAVVIVASKFVIDNGLLLANLLHVRQSLIGILLIGLGTGLPELSVAIVAIRRDALVISMGDLIGSNICDLLLSLGAGAVISGFIVERGILFFDLPMLMLFTLLFVGFMWSRKKINRREGILLICCYLLYVFLKVFYIG